MDRTATPDPFSAISDQTAGGDPSAAVPALAAPPIADIEHGWHYRIMDTVYVLHHVRADDEFGDDAKLIGVYRSHEAATQAIERLKDQPGFREHPEGFHAEAYPLDRDHWAEGFISSQ